MKTYYSFCCGCEMPHPDSEIETCPDCKEICEVVEEDDETIPENAKEFKPQVNLNNYSLKNLL